MGEGKSAAAPIAAPGQARRWHFASAVLDELTLELTVSGVEAEIERKPLEVLMHLLAHAGEVVTKDELLAAVWPGRILSDTVLTKAIGRVREVLRDDDQALIKTVYGYGYRLVAPVRVELTRAPERAHFDFNAGDHPPNRPLWSLVHRLGAGGHGEAWLGQHDKTREQRVFKFAIDEHSLTALKREITLFRFLNDSLGERARIVPLIDWNLEQPPCFIESQYIAGGSLIDWAERTGGLSKIPLTTRLEVAAQIAEALATIHSVGVLHKDLKPSNILIDASDGQTPRILLADFGSGGVLDARQLEALGITRLGFTRTVALTDTTSGTPLYLPPEVLAGQPPTVQGDIYALGVMLYQLVIGELRKAMNAGWERDVEDELLRADIALAAEGDATRRLTDASELAQRLRSLQPRRRRLTEERETQAREERARRAQDRAKARRVGLALAFGTLVVGLIVSTVMYLRASAAQQRAQVAAAQSAAVTDFLSNDVFVAVSAGTDSTKNLTVSVLLESAGKNVDSRFAKQPEIASQLHFIIGRSLNEVNDTPLAIPHFKRALELGEQLKGEGSESALNSAAELAALDYAVGRLRETLPRYERTLEVGIANLEPGNPALLALRLRMARSAYLLGNWIRAEQALQVLLNDARTQPSVTTLFVGRVEFNLGQVLTELSRLPEAQAQLRASIDHLSESLGPAHGEVSEARTALGKALLDSGEFAEAARELDAAQRLAQQWTTEMTYTVMRPKFFKALLLLQRGRLAEAGQTFTEILAKQEAYVPVYQERYRGYDEETDKTGTVRQALAEVYARQGRTVEAIKTLRDALGVSTISDGPQHPTTLSIRAGLAEALLGNGEEEEARAVFAESSFDGILQLAETHPHRLKWQRVAALLAESNN